MIKKRRFIYLGLVISSMGLLLVIKNLSITGSAIDKSINYLPTYILPVILFIIGILMATSSDGLQAWLEKKEKEHHSPSLEGKVQTEKEKKEFGKRYSGNVPWYRKIGKANVEQIEQDDKRYTQPVDSSYGYPGKTPPDVRAKTDEEARIIPEIRKKVLLAKKRIDKLSESGDIKDYYDSIKNYYESAVQLKNALGKSGLNMPENVETEYIRIGKGRTDKAISRESERLKEDVTENRAAFSHGYPSPIAERHRILEKVKTSYASDQTLPSMEELERLYLEKGKTVLISKFTRENIFFHSFPLGSRANQNTHGAGYDHTTSIRDFITYIEDERPMLSVASMPSNGQENIMTRFAGVVLKEGKIYDASSRDITSQARQGKKARFRGIDEAGDANLPINKRADLALTRNSYRQNELIVGDYVIGGLYFDSKHLQSMTAQNGLKKADIIPQITNEALERNLPLYDVTEKGFERVDPKKYVHK